jgi:hypothetical protein
MGENFLGEGFDFKLSQKLKSNKAVDSGMLPPQRDIQVNEVQFEIVLDYRIASAYACRKARPEILRRR